MSRISRVFANIFEGWFQLSRRFPSTLLDEVADAVGSGEQTHAGEVRVVIEARLSPGAVLRGIDATTRARQLFAQLHVWDTEHNSGVLLYLLLAEHRIEIVVDRGMASRVDEAAWQAVCQSMREAFARKDWSGGLLYGIEQIHGLLREHFPSDGQPRLDELPDRPLLL